MVPSSSLASTRSSAASAFTSVDLPTLRRPTIASSSSGEAADREAVDLYAFTSVIKNRLDHAARVEFIEILWEIVLADGELHELEDNIVWRVAELIAVEREELTKKLIRMFNARPDNALYLDAADDAPYGAVLGALDLAKAAQAHPIVILTKKME